jgi:nucleoside-diphosphate-sugar epimerase
MRVLVTGHKGFIGSVMVPALLRGDIDVDGMDTDLHRECTFARSLGSVPEIEGDIHDAAPADLEGFDAIINLAALSNGPLGDSSRVMPSSELEAWKYQGIGQVKQLMKSGRLGPDARWT